MATSYARVGYCRSQQRAQRLWCQSADETVERIALDGILLQIAPSFLNQLESCYPNLLVGNPFG
jgi:hypothetical protein